MWTIDKEEDTFTLKKYFNGEAYLITICAYHTYKSTRFYVGASSGTKKKDLDIFEQKDNKSSGGIKALLWIVEETLKFPEYYKKHDIYKSNKQYICINWADYRRKKIYMRLERRGFRLSSVNKELTLIKRVR